MCHPSPENSHNNLANQDHRRGSHCAQFCAHSRVGLLRIGDDGGSFCLGDLNRTFARARNADAISLEGEVFGVHLQGIFEIIDQQDQGRQRKPAGLWIAIFGTT